MVTSPLVPLEFSDWTPRVGIVYTHVFDNQLGPRFQAISFTFWFGPVQYFLGRLQRAPEVLVLAPHRVLQDTQRRVHQGPETGRGSRLNLGSAAAVHPAHVAATNGLRAAGLAVLPPSRAELGLYGVLGLHGVCSGSLLVLPFCEGTGSHFHTWWMRLILPEFLQCLRSGGSIGRVES